MSLTPAQQKAVVARGNVLVMAGAGTGKTSTLVERCLHCLLNENPPASIDEILMVTFTEAAAAEMRQRIRDRLEQESLKADGGNRWHEELALFESAHFGTLHSFCLHLVRQHFFQLELDPQLSVLPAEEARMLADETLENLFRAHYAGTGEVAEAVQRLVQTQGRGWDRPIRSLVLRLHHYSQTLPSPAGWIESQLTALANPEPTTWRRWLADAVAGLPHTWLGHLESLSPGNKVATRCAAALRVLSPQANLPAFAAICTEIDQARRECDKGKKGAWLQPLKEFFREFDFVFSLIGPPGGADPLVEDWSWVREQMNTLVTLTREFSQAFAEAKRELGAVDFHDLEQHALRLLWDERAQEPTAIALEWRKKLRFVFVDEYQDINAAQDRIIQALARDGAQANRFLVGDVKQSIYRFRLANPYIFQSYARQWTTGNSQVLPLVDNFRSREGLLNFANSLFGLLITPELGGVDYRSEAALRFGAPQDRAELSSAAPGEPTVELQLLLSGAGEAFGSDDEESEAPAEVMDLQQAEKEARLVALQLQKLHAARHRVWDVQTRRFRPVEWRDMAILLRSPSGKSESYAKEFARLNLPLRVERGAFYRSVEISDLVSLLQVLDNPLQDLPLLAVLHSPLVGLSANELAEIRLTTLKVSFWTALTRWQRPGGAPPATGNGPIQPQITGAPSHHVETSEIHRKVNVFLDQFARWRRLARQASLSRCLETVLAETHYATWLLTQPRGAQRQANVRRLLSLTQDFDRFQRQGLFRFLKFIETQQAFDTEPEVAAAPAEDGVRLMSIHQSKGLEFPVVVLADLGKPFNQLDLHADIILDEEYGLCPQVKPPHTGKRYPSLPHWLARRRQLRELLGEELRLLYVATTRARDKLILAGTISAAKLSKLRRGEARPDAPGLLAARNYLDWIGLWLSLNASVSNDAYSGENALIRWRIHELMELADPASHTAPSETRNRVEIDFASEQWRQVQDRLAWEYPFLAATNQPAKSSVSSLRRQAATDIDEAASPTFSAPPRAPTGGAETTTNDVGSAPGRTLSATDIGNAHHALLQLASLDGTNRLSDLAREAERLQKLGQLTPEQVAVLDLESIAHFWNSGLGHRIQARRPFIHRELPFTARFTPGELSVLLGRTASPELANEFVLVQGVADLAVIAPDEIWLVDFKTDQLSPEGLGPRAKSYEPQLRLYAAALSKIYRRPVSECWLYFLGPREAVAVS